MTLLSPAPRRTDAPRAGGAAARPAARLAAHAEPGRRLGAGRGRRRRARADRRHRRRRAAGRAARPAALVTAARALRGRRGRARHRRPGGVGRRGRPRGGHGCAADLLDAALHQPLSVLSEQAVGEVLDRVDDDTHELGTLLRRNVWDLVRTLLRAGPMWVVAGPDLGPAWLLFPLAGVGTVLVARPLTAEIARRKVREEIAWTDHAAAVEEGVAARDDLRSSLGQAYVVRRCAELSARRARPGARPAASPRAGSPGGSGCCCTACSR